MLIFIPILIFFLSRWSLSARGVKIVPQGYQWTVERFAAIPKRYSRGSVWWCRLWIAFHRKINMMRSARHPFPGSYLER